MGSNDENIFGPVLRPIILPGHHTDRCPVCLVSMIAQGPLYYLLCVSYFSSSMSVCCNWVIVIVTKTIATVNVDIQGCKFSENFTSNYLKMFFEI